MKDVVVSALGVVNEKKETQMNTDPVNENQNSLGAELESPRPAQARSLLREPSIVHVLIEPCDVCGGPYRACDCLPTPLVVTRDGVPCPDQKAALREFMAACERRSGQPS